MPADAVHLAAIDDVEDEGGPVRAMIAAPALSAAARLGAVFVDLPYYERFLVALAAHAAGRSVAWSSWGDVFHHQAPMALAHWLIREAAQLQGARRTRAEGQWLSAFTLGYVCHAAVDRTLHPLINWLASRRAGDAVRAHQQVEKLQSILFHRERFGRELLGTTDVSAYMAVDASPLWRDPVISRALETCLRSVFGRAPSAEQLERWHDGYGTYVRLLTTSLGKQVVRDEELEAERGPVYDAVAFPQRFSSTVAYATTCLNAVMELWNQPADQPSLLDAVLPEGTIDPPAEAPVAVTSSAAQGLTS